MKPTKAGHAVRLLSCKPLMQAEVLWLMHAKHRWLAGDPVGARAIMSEVRRLHVICLAHACVHSRLQIFRFYGAWVKVGQLQ